MQEHQLILSTPKTFDFLTFRENEVRQCSTIMCSDVVFRPVLFFTAACPTSPQPKELVCPQEMMVEMVQKYRDLEAQVRIFSEWRLTSLQQLFFSLFFDFLFVAQASKLDYQISEDKKTLATISSLRKETGATIQV